MHDYEEFDIPLTGAFGRGSRVRAVMDRLYQLADEIREVPSGDA